MPRVSLYSGFKPINLRSKRTASDAQGANEYWWAGPPYWACHLQLIGPHWLYFS
jgi:hypothetical protein